MKSGNLNFLEPSGPLQACNGTDVPLPSTRIFIIAMEMFVFKYKHVYQFTCTKQKERGYGEVHKSLQNCGSSFWNLLHVTLLLPRIWRWLLDFWGVCGLFCWTIVAGSVHQTLSSTLSLSCINFLFTAKLKHLISDQHVHSWEEEKDFSYYVCNIGCFTNF